MNYSKLRGRIIEKYGSVSSFSDRIGKSRQTVDNKLHNRTEMSRKDIEEWADALEIKGEFISVYFFAE